MRSAIHARYIICDLRFAHNILPAIARYDIMRNHRAIENGSIKSRIKSDVRRRKSYSFSDISLMKKNEMSIRLKLKRSTSMKL